MSWNIGAPSSGLGQFKKDEHESHVLGFVAPRFEEVTSKFGPSNAAKCRYIVCVDCEKVFEDAAIFGQVIVERLTEEEQELIGGYIELVAPMGGGNRYWMLEELSDDGRAKLHAWLDAHATQDVEGHIVIDRSF